ncbi:hypothetical protein GOP47_0022825 [Adiantum capillus-veneris]|uniref:TMEM205-like domain-containing protein n=1 Tax=Adiantum capillus-veneris TaxID=13818 RepID=A0A9D4U649_ADICA|nr:hypothetical protein GOP47_0022825 [Adiantum capillus-veneris]
MNIVALAFLLSYFSTVVVLVPEPHLTQADHRAEGYTSGDVFRSAKESIQNAGCGNEPCPSSMDQVKETVHKGYEKTAEGIDKAKEGTKETVKGVYDQAKHGVQDKGERAAQGIQDTTEKVKHGAQETAQGIQEKAGQAKEGVYETAEQAKEKFSSFVPSTDDVKRGTFETSEKLSSYIPSKEEAASYIPGAEMGKEAANILKQKVGEVKEKGSSYVQDTDPLSYGKEALDSLRSKLEEARREAAQFLQGREKESSLASFADMKLKLDEASAYIPSKESAVSYIPGVDILRSKLDEARHEVAQSMQGREKESSYAGFANMKKKLDEAASYMPYIPGVESIEKIKQGVEETAQSVRDKVQDVSERARDATKGSTQGMRDKAREAGDAAASYKEAREGYTGKIGGMFQGMKDRITGRPKTGDGSAQLARRVHELCMWFTDDTELSVSPKGAGGAPSLLDVAAMRESYAYLMQSALSAIERAHELFEHATTGNTGGEWREKYVYLADTGKGALEAAKEVFERAAAAAEGTLRPRQVPTHRVFAYGKAKNMSKLGEVAVHTKERLSAILRPFLRTIYLATFSAIYGISLWMTFLSGHLLSRTLPRQQLGVVQSKLFPVYLRMITVCVVLSGLIHVLLHPWPSADRPEHWQYVNFALCTGLALLNMLVVEPRATKMMFEKLRVEKEEGRGQRGEEVTDDAVKERIASINVKFRGLHQMASYLNLGIVAGLTWHLWYLANRLVV